MQARLVVEDVGGHQQLVGAMAMHELGNALRHRLPVADHGAGKRTLRAQFFHG